MRSPDFPFLAQSNNSYHFFVSFPAFFAFGFFSTELVDLSPEHILEIGVAQLKQEQAAF